VTYPQYTIWKDWRTGDFEVVRWDAGGEHEIVQTNIKTRAKAIEALKIWQQREDDRGGKSDDA
jgi:hypothetical protein